MLILNCNKCALNDRCPGEADCYLTAKARAEALTAERDEALKRAQVSETECQRLRRELHLKVYEIKELRDALLCLQEIHRGRR